MNQDFVFKKYHVSAAVYPVGMARCAEGTLAPRPDLPSLLTVGWRWTEPQLSLLHLSPGLGLLNSLLAPPGASSTPQPRPGPMAATLADYCPALGWPPASSLPLVPRWKPTVLF